jgi:hypothetical protein
MPNVTPLSEQRRGSNGWAIEELLFRGLEKLIKDLRRQESRGFEEEICEQIREALHRMARGADTATSASFSPEIIIESNRFRQRYQEWNRNGTKSDETAISSRRALISDLFLWRSKMMEILRSRRKGYISFATDDDFEIVARVYDQLDGVTSKYPNTFRLLGKSVAAFKAAAKQRALSSN